MRTNGGPRAANRHPFDYIRSVHLQTAGGHRLPSSGAPPAPFRLHPPPPDALSRYFIYAAAVVAKHDASFASKHGAAMSFLIGESLPPSLHLPLPLMSLLGQCTELSL